MSTDLTHPGRNDSTAIEPIRCPDCGGESFHTLYLVPALHAVTLSRDERGEILISRPGPCIEAPRAPEPRDFRELRCARCGAQLDWELDHRSLYACRL